MGGVRPLVKEAARRFKTLNGNHLAGAITLAGFLSLFPLILLFVAVLGFLAAGRLDLASDITSKLGLGDSTSGIVTDVIDQAKDSRGAATVVSLLTLLWSGLRVVDANQFAFNSAWGIDSRRGIRAKLVGLAWLAGVGGLFVVSIAASAVAAVVLPGPLASLGFLVGLGVDVVLWLWTFTLLVNNDKPWRAHLGGAVVGAVGTGVLKIGGAYWVPRSVASASELYGSIGVVFALLLWLLLFGRLAVFAAILNSVRADDADHPAHEVQEAGEAGEALNPPGDPAPPG